MLTSILSLACPLGRDGQELTNRQLMINFSRALIPADRLAAQASAEPEEIEKALKGIEMALSCVEVALNKDCTEALMPAKVSRLDEVARDDYTEKYYGYMREFQTQLQKYKILLEQRDFKGFSEQKKQITEWVNQAHCGL